MVIPYNMPYLDEDKDLLESKLFNNKAVIPPDNIKFKRKKKKK